MTTVLAALGSDASAQPVLSTAIAVAALFDATVVALHVRENGASIPEPLASAAGVELREVSGSPIDQIVAATQDPDVAALVLGARGVHGGPQPAGHTALEVITRVPKPVAVVPPNARPPEQFARILIAARRDQRELARARGHDQARSPTRAEDPRPARPLASHRARVLRSRPSRNPGMGARVPLALHRHPARPRQRWCAASASLPTTWSRSPTKPAPI